MNTFERPELFETYISPATVAFIETGHDLLVTGVRVSEDQEPTPSIGFIRVTPLSLYMRTGEGGDQHPALLSRSLEDELIHFDAREATGFQVLPIAD
jgi:hypothetical protein